MKGLVIAVDLDGTLCEGQCWTPEDAEKATPIPDYIDKVNKLYFTNFIVIYTARRDKMIPSTLQWLRRNGVLFHAISNLKCPADLYIDDISKRPEEL